MSAPGVCVIHQAGRLVRLFALLAIVSPAGGDEQERTFPFSQKIDFKVGEEISLEGTIGRLELTGVLMETDKWADDDYLIRLRVSVHNPEGHDMALLVRATYQDAEGRRLATEEDEFEIEEDEMKKFKVTAHVPKDPAGLVATLLLEIDAWQD